MNESTTNRATMNSRPANDVPMTIASDESKRRYWLAALDPRLKLVWLACVSAASVLFDAPAALAVLFALGLALATGVRMSRRRWVAVAALLVAIAWSTLLSQAIFYSAVPRTTLATLVPSFEIGGWRFSGLRLFREGAWHGLAQSLRMLAVTITGLAVCQSTSPERLLAALVRLKVPVAVGFMVSTALRFVPLLASEYSMVRQARRLRGYRIRPFRRGQGLAAAARGELSLVVPILGSAVRRATALATSVTSRGFDPQARRTFYPPLRMRRAERVGVFALLVAFGLLLATKSAYWLYVGEIYYHPALRGVYDFARRWL